MKTIKTEKIPIKLWLDDIEPEALAQAKNLANHPHAFKHIAIMPDSHTGYGMPIGGVLAARDVIIPNAVGVDIGCGMCAVKTSLHSVDRVRLKGVLGSVRKQIPLGFKKHKKGRDVSLMPEQRENGQYPVLDREWNNARKSLGTLGGGNHFIEIQQGSQGNVWIMVHSGSRNLGKQVAEFYNKKAVAINESSRKPIPKAHQLAFLERGSVMGEKYFNEMSYCIEYALANRKQMMEVLMAIFTDTYKGKIDFDAMINIAHNYAALENHFDTDVIVHRKGATRAGTEQTGIIPGSQGSKSYIVQGKGNPESFLSCSHGAGRRLGRKQALRELDFDAEVEKLDSKGILHSIRHKRDLEEAMSAYKDIDVVMRNQQDLVDILVELTPLGVVKG
ncbi:MAG: RtcB family protein [bacterium]|nr:RtcB family protein [bacterium]